MKETNNIQEGYNNSPLGIITKDRGIIELGNILSKISNGVTYDVNNFLGYKVTRIETISTSNIDYSKVGYFFNNSGLEEYKLLKGDILFSHINSLSQIGKLAYYDDDLELYHV